MRNIKDFTVDIELDLEDVLADVECDEVVNHYPLKDLLTEMDGSKVVDWVADNLDPDEVWERIQDEVDKDEILKYISEHASSFGVKIIEVNGED